MKTFRADVEIAVTATKRKGTIVVVPPWTVPGMVRVGSLGEWSPLSNLRITGGYINVLSGAGNSSMSLSIVKNSAFSGFMGSTTLGTVSMSGASTLNKKISLVDQMSGFTLVSPAERLQMVITASSAVGYKGLTIQLEAEEVN